MESLPQAVSLARALLTLSRAGQSGVLHVAAVAGTCRFAIVEGVPRAAEGALGEGPTLGDELMRMGELDASAHMRALAATGEQPAAGSLRAGDWLVARGLVTRGAVQLALRRQLRARLCAVLRSCGLDYRFAPGTPALQAPWIEEPLSAPDLVLAAMRSLIAERPLPELARMVDGGRLGLSGLGRALLQGAALWPEEAAAAAALARGAELTEVLRAGRGSPRVLTALATWTLLGAVVPLQQPRDGRYGLLLRKSRQLRAAVGAHALLDLSGDDAPAPSRARRALRSLVPRVHPDGLGSGARPELRSACNEVLGALLDAERRLSAGSPRARGR